MSERCAKVPPKRPHLDTLMDVPQLKGQFWNPFLAFRGLSALRPARAPVSCVWGFFFFFFPQSLNWNIFSFGLKLCQRVQGPWHEWYWNSNESPTGGLFTWSHTLRPLNPVYFYFFFIIFSYKCICLVQINPLHWHPMTQWKPVLK